jgi:hypothetical protein
MKCTFSIVISLVFPLKIGALLYPTSWNRLYIRQLLFLNFQRRAEKDALMATVSFLETRRNHKGPN